MYEITPYTLEKARAAGLVVLNSRRLHKKIDVYKDAGVASWLLAA